MFPIREGGDRKSLKRSRKKEKGKSYFNGGKGRSGRGCLLYVKNEKKDQEIGQG